MLNQLIDLLYSSSLDAVHGSMQVFNEFVKSDLTEDQILPVLRQLLPALLNILGSPQHTLSPLTRARAVSVFRQCVTTPLFMVKEQQAVKEVSESILPVWIDVFKHLLSVPVQQDVHNNETWDGLSIRIEIINTLENLHTGFPKSLSPHLGDFLTLLLSHLRDLLPTFLHYYTSSSSDSPTTASEDEPIEPNKLGCPVLDFATAAVHSSKSKQWLQSPGNLEGLVVATFGRMQMS